MSPKEKADSLVDMFYEYADGTNDFESFEKAIAIENAKKCADKCVDEMIEENNSLLEYAKTHMDDRAILVVKFRIIWLTQAKQEILNYKSTITTTK